MRFVIWQDTDGQWRWTLWGRNGKKIGCAGEGFKRKASAIKICYRINPDIPVKVKL